MKSFSEWLWKLPEGRAISCIFLGFNMVPSKPLGIREIKYTNIFRTEKLSFLQKRSAQSCTAINTERDLGGAYCFSEASPFQSQCL